ncbi:bifunctional diguanylate cyclase/phosphodiesterase [Croceibacterium ferulae]|uniref:bifunctional diguanylate cyclase/phosphodiesterase n=1 Tax=Croceibacterium ferulae TaxID=1854641 RepID=UPI0013904CFD|nr:bifunctional diguanylate cyclase/phosphodiesterase [Croceibacterium ferulae]
MLLIGTCLGSLVLIVAVTTRAQDKLQLAREQHSVEQAVQNTVEMAIHDLQDYAKWDDAVRHISQKLDTEWIADNVVAYLAGTQGYSHVLVLDGSDNVVFARVPGGAIKEAATLVAAREFRREVANVRAMPVTGNPIVGGYVRLGSKVYIYTVAQIVPVTEKVRLPERSTHLLAIARPIDSDFLRSLADNQQVQQLSLVLEPVRAGSQVALGGVGGKTQAWLTWKPSTPGAELSRGILPLFLIVGVLTLAVGALIVRLGAGTIKALQSSETHARHLALHDALTGLPNRRALMQHIESLAADSADLTLLWHDLDGFKDVNDLYGHAAGDAVLRQVEERLSAALPCVFVARVGGDEFVAVLNAPSVEDIHHATGAVLGAFAASFLVGTYQIRLGVSIGCAGLGGSSLSPSELMRRADAAMYAAKSQGKGCWRVFEASMDHVHHLRVTMEKDLGEAIATGGIEVVYQPIVDAGSNKIVAVEALSRWTHPVHGTVSPDVFIPLAEQVGMIDALGRHVLREACRASAALPIQLSINLSPAQFWDQNLVRDISMILEEAHFPSERLEVEITESYLLRQPQAAAEILEQLRGTGVTVALDDFGTGFASIGYLRQLPLDRLKIDKQFIKPLESGGRGLDLVCAISALAASLGLEITAEGVETEEQAAMARLAGCSQLQGWLFGRPMAMSDLVDLLETTATSPARQVA